MANRKKTALPTKSEFVGAQMSNFLHALKNEIGVPYTFREKASQLQEKWDSFATFRINNPIVAIELEAKLFPKAEKSA